MGLINESVKDKEMDDYIEKIISSILKGGKNALAKSKELIFSLESRKIDNNVLRETAQRIADARSSEEGKEGVDAFLNKRTPSWLE
jgi:methylglutaconyl-CoA hydratase